MPCRAQIPLECDAPAHAHDREDQREARGRGEMTVRLHDGQTAAQDIARWLACLSRVEAGSA